MRKIQNGITFLFYFLSVQLSAKAVYAIPTEMRHTVTRNDASEIVYYFIPPTNTHKTYPIAMLCEGSSTKGRLESVIRIHKAWGLHQKLETMGIGVITVEKRGIDGNNINEEEFFEHYTRTNRFNDHCHVIETLKKRPPKGWDGKLIFIGGSEGGPLVLSLTLKYFTETVATVNWAGASDNTWPDEIWDFFYHGSWLMWLVGIYELPWSKSGLDKKFNEMRQNPSSKKWFAGMTYRYHADVFVEQERNKAYTTIKTPLLVVTGTKDTIIETSDSFVHKAKQNGVPITYYRIEGARHYETIDPKFNVIEKTLQWLNEQLTIQGIL